MSLATALIQWLVGERTLGRRAQRRRISAPEPELQPCGIEFRDVTKRYGATPTAPLACKGISFERAARAR